ncbi:MAG TPA: bifunctional riboflavin kinase/FAD synthetase [Gemmatimonadaceae bacterium]|nr:bifunctional riboflavin kinase/FAD synthetase [Gemmatimonadaceae bacterium]
MADRITVVDDDSGLPPDVRETVLTVGTFDGVHLGHQDVLRRLVARARATRRHSVLVTFDPHPLEIVRPESAPALLTLADEKMEVLAELGLDYMVVLPFTRTLASYDAEDFVDLVLRERYRVAELLIGYDHGFGRNRAGDVETLVRLGGERGFAVEVVHPVDAGGERPVSSTLIRTAVAAGRLEVAARGLGRAYSVSGRVIHGEQRGRALGYPTLNVAVPSSRKLLPPEGVYAVRVQTPDGPFGGMLSLGPRPTFDDPRQTLEAHLFDARGDWYDAPVRLDFVERLRDIQRFDGPANLIRQLAEDERRARGALTTSPAAGNVLYSAVS